MSEESKHTPGPWIDESCIVRDKTKQIRIAKCDESWQLDWREMDANARLIAAAPDLLDALKEMRDTFCHAASKSDAGSDAWNRARAAIDKAEGRAE